MSQIHTQSRLRIFAFFLLLTGGIAWPAAINAQDRNDRTEIVTNTPQDQLSKASYAMIAANMLDRVIRGEDVKQHMELLKSANPNTLAAQLNTDELRRCFWIDIYNGYTQYFLKHDPALYKKDRSAFFKKDQIAIAGFHVAMNDIEHGVLRRGATIWTKGFLRLPWRNAFVRKFRVSKVDWHIHFALNCGAKSCPPVCVYLPEKADEQLDKAAALYLRKECVYKKKENEVSVPALLSWFSEDFGSKNAKRKILMKYKIIPEKSDPKISYKEYDWDIFIENYHQF